MKILFIAGSMFILSCSSINYAKENIPQYQKIKCRITYYCGLDEWGDRVACQKTKRAIAGTTVAAHPDFAFGQKIHIPDLAGIIGDGNFIVQDRGGAVTRKTAAQGKTYVFDVYVKTASEMHNHARRRPMYMDVWIKK